MNALFLYEILVSREDGKVTVRIGFMQDFIEVKEREKFFDELRRMKPEIVFRT